MDTFRSVTRPPVHKDLRRLPKATVSRVMARIRGLTSDPRPHGVVKLSGADRMYRIRVGDYRIIYEVDEEAKAAAAGAVVEWSRVRQEHRG